MLIRHTIVAAGLSLLFAGCASTADVKKYQEQLLAKANAPDWVIRGNGAFTDGAFYGVGSAAGIEDPAVRREVADDRARNDLIKLLAIDSSSLQRDYQASSATKEEQRIEMVIQTITHATVAGIVIADHWEHPARNELYSLAKMDIRKFEAALGQVKDLSAKVRAAQSQELERKIRDQEERTASLDTRIREQEAAIQRNSAAAAETFRVMLNRWFSGWNDGKPLFASAEVAAGKKASNGAKPAEYECDVANYDGKPVTVLMEDQGTFMDGVRKTWCGYIRPALNFLIGSQDQRW